MSEGEKSLFSTPPEAKNGGSAPKEAAKDEAKHLHRRPRCGIIAMIVRVGYG